jgi:pilus assembly protein CpaE
MEILVLAATPFHTEILVPARVARAIAEARNSYDFVILDLHPDFGPLNLALFALADRIIIPVTPDVPCIRAALQFREVATALDLRHRLLMVINRANSGVPPSQVESTVAIPTLARIRSAGPIFFESSDTGKSAVERYPNDKAIGEIYQMTDTLLDILNSGTDGGKQSKGGFLGGLFGRRGKG